jgi:two-component system, NtrC family, sensor histidine kinase KinB
MKVYRLTVNLKLGLIVAAVAMAIASLAYTNQLVERLRAREQAAIQLWADAQEQVAASQAVAINPYEAELAALDRALARQQVQLADDPVFSPERLRDAVRWARGMPPPGELSFITNEIIVPNPFGIPAIVTDSASGRPLFWRGVNVPVELWGLSPADSARAIRRLENRLRQMDALHAPIPIEITVPVGEGVADLRFVQYVHYDESRLVRELRFYPWIQLLFVSLFVLVGYLGFSYVRRDEQSNLWVGMAREAAHQLGTPISSLMGWLELLRARDLPDEIEDEALTEIEKDIDRLRRVTSRFSDIGSVPRLDAQSVAPLVERTADYMRRRMPSAGRSISLDVNFADGCVAPVNAELFEWVIENLVKNALDAIEERQGKIEIVGSSEEDMIVIDVSDTGKGIERRQWKNVFRPGYSTKKRGWGLGLSLARRIIEDYHGGSLVVAASKPGQGTTFRISIPRNQERARVPRKSAVTARRG